MMQTNKPAQPQKIDEDIEFYSKLLANHSAIKDGVRILKEQREINLTNLKESCVVELKRFMDMRGMLDKSTGKVHLPLLSVSPQNEARVMQSIRDADHLIQHIEHATSLSELDEKLQRFISDNTALSEDLMATINQCLTITSTFKGHAL